MFSSESDLWATPQDFFDRLNDEFHFTLDPCADESNYKCNKYFTEKEDGLSQDWSEQVVFCNPPYSKGETACKPGCTKKSCTKRGYHLDKYKPGQDDWIKKCYEESRKNNTTVVMLIPARTDKEVMHDYIFKHARAICFIKGRLRFGSAKDVAPFPSMLVVFGNAEFNYIEEFGHWIKLR